MDKVIIAIIVIILAMFILAFIFIINDYFIAKQKEGYGTIIDKRIEEDIQTKDGKIYTTHRYILQIEIDNFKRVQKEIIYMDYDLYIPGDRVYIEWKEGIFLYIGKISLVRK